MRPEITGGVVGGIGALAFLTAFQPEPLPDDISKLIWYAIRVTGIGAYLALWLTTVAGLCLSAKVGGRLGAVLLPIHQLGDLALGLALLHATLLLGDRFAGFAAQSIVVPFISTYRPFATGLGIVALYLALGVHWSVEIRPRIGYRAWHVIHLSGLVVFFLALMHGLLAGTDSPIDSMQALYAGTGLTVAGLVGLRVRQALAVSSSVTASREVVSARPLR